MPLLLRPIVWLIAVLALASVTLAAPPQSDSFASAKRAAQQAARSTHSAKRREALEALARFPSDEALDLIVQVGLKAKDDETRSAARKVLARMAAEQIDDADNAGAPRAAEDEQAAAAESAAGIRQHLHDLLDRERTPAGPVAVGLATALLAAEPAGDAKSLLTTLDGSDSQALVLCWGIATAAAADGAEGVPVLVALSTLRVFSDDFSFRRGVVRGLIAIHQPDSVVALIALLQTLRGEVRADVAGYLEAISGVKKGIDADAWQAWWGESGAGFRFPPGMATYPVPTVAPGEAGNAYYQIPVYAERIVFVIDTSASMAGERMETAKRELVSAIHTLSPDTLFTVVAFSDAAAFVRALVPAGKTASFDALDAAFRYDAEAIFFLSDGAPTTGRIVDPGQIVRFVAEANKNRRLSLHTIGIMPEAGLATFLQALAAANHGAYRHVAD